MVGGQPYCSYSFVMLPSLSVTLVNTFCFFFLDVVLSLFLTTIFGQPSWILFPACLSYACTDPVLYKLFLGSKPNFSFFPQIFSILVFGINSRICILYHALQLTYYKTGPLLSSLVITHNSVVAIIVPLFGLGPDFSPNFHNNY